MVLDKEHYKKQIEDQILTLEKLLTGDMCKELWYLIYCVQNYCRKGGKEDLW